MLLSIFKRRRKRRKGGNVNTPSSWVPFGNDLIGEGSEDNFGNSISLNAAGNVIAVGAFNNGAGKGSARIFSRSGNSWIQRGLDIDGTNTNDEFGRGISLNAAGDRVAITAQGNGGYTRVYSWNESSWVKLGQDLIGGGVDVVLNGAGSLLVVRNKVYSWNETSWTQVGGDLFDGFIFGAASNSTGDRVVLGEQFSGLSQIRVFDRNGSSWMQVGQAIDSPQINSGLGGKCTIDINSAGNRIILGAPGFNSSPSIDNGLVRVYDWNGTSWEQVGQDITGVVPEFVGECVGIDATGNRIIVGSTGTGPSRSGKAVVYDWNGTSWVQVFQVTGSVQSYTGRDVDISSNGRTIAIGDQPSGQRGRVRVYDLIGGYSRALENGNSRKLENDSERLLELGLNTWSQVGQNIFGLQDGIYQRNASDSFPTPVSNAGLGGSVALNDSGNILAIGSGRMGLRVYEYTYNNWSLRAPSNSNYILPTTIVSNTGTSETYVGPAEPVAINSSGDVLVSKGFQNTVYVNQWNGTNYVNIRSIGGAVQEDSFGRSLDIDSAGNRVVIGSPYDDSSYQSSIGNNYGAAHIYSNVTVSETSETKILGESLGELFGFSVGMNAAGDRFVAGGPGTANTATSNGCVRVYSRTGTSWSKIGQTINGEIANEGLGYSVSINTSGDTIAIASRSNTLVSGNYVNKVKVFKLIGTTWTQQGTTLSFESSSTSDGISITINGAGDRIAVKLDAIVRVYYWSNDWLLHTNINVSNTGGNVSMDSQGTLIATGSPRFAVGSQVRGIAQTYKDDSRVEGPMLLIPRGSFTMGDSLDGIVDATPTRTVTLDSFYICKYEVTRGEWNEVRAWGLNNGYTDLASEIPMHPDMGFGAASDHPIGYVDWFDAVKWCNARSQKEGLTPVYYTNSAQTTVYKTGDINLPNTHVKWDANGYRLPTEAEWEKAARGGLNGKRYPLGDTITRAQANYMNFTGVGGANRPNTTAVGSFLPNGYGLYDVAGNVDEMCWDYYAESYNPSDLTNPRGPTSGDSFNRRVSRGGSWSSTNTVDVRVALRTRSSPSGSANSIGFRVARSNIS